jgi:hypothetical protein
MENKIGILVSHLAIGRRDRNRCFRTVFCEILENEIQNALSVDGLKKRIEYLLTLEYGSV